MRYVWLCSEKYKVKGVVGCDNTHVNDGKLYEAFINAYNVLVRNKDELTKKWELILNEDDAWKAVTAKRFINHFKEAEEITEFNSGLFYKTVEKLMVTKSGKIVVSLLDGSEIECEIE